MNASQWNSIKKHSDKAKKMLSSLHMSPAYLKVSWSELDEGEQRKVSDWVAKNGSGWFERGEQVSTSKGIRTVAPKHRKAAIKKELKGVAREPMKKETEPKIGRTSQGRYIQCPNCKVRHMETGIGFPEICDVCKTTLIKTKSARTKNKEEEKELDIKCPECGHNMVSASKEYSEAVRGAVKEGTPICRVHGTLEDIKRQTGKSLLESGQKEESWSIRAKNAGINLKGLYIDDTNGIRFRMMNGAFANKTAFRCPEDYRGLVFNTDFKLACGEHGSLTSSDKAIDLRKIGVDKKTTEWALKQLKGWLSEAKLEGFNTVAEYVDSLKAQGKDNGYAQYAEIGRGLETRFPAEAKGMSKEIEKEIAAEKVIPVKVIMDNSEPAKPKDKSGTTIYLEKEYKSRLESLSTEPIPLSNPDAEEITDAIEFAKTSMVPILMHFDKVDVQIRYWRDTQGTPTGLEIIVFDEFNSPLYHNRDYDMNLTAAEVFMIRDSETKHIETVEKEDRAKKEAEAKRFKFNKTTLSLYNKTYPMAMSYFLYHIVTLPPTVRVDNITDEWLDKINKYVAEGYETNPETGIYTVEWFKEKNEKEKADEDRVLAKKESEKPSNKSYFKIVQAVPWRDHTDKKTIKVPIEKPHPFTYKEIEFVSHIEKPDWHVTEVTTGLKFAVGRTQQQAEFGAKELVDKRGAEQVMDKLKEARKALELE